MYKRAPGSLTGALIALSLVGAPGLSFAQNDMHNQNGSRMNGSSSYSSDTSNMQWAGPSAGAVAVTQIFNDKGYTQTDLESILPLLQDLRDAQQTYYGNVDSVYNDSVGNHGSNYKMSGDTRVTDNQKWLSDRRNSIWTTITDRLGSDKATALRNAVEPKTEDVSRNTYTDVYLQRIDTMLADLDKMSAARIAANGIANPVDTDGVRQASVETRTTVTTTVAPSPIWVTTPAVIDVKDLINVVQDRIVADEIGNSDYLILSPMGRDLNSTDIQFLRELKWMVW